MLALALVVVLTVVRRPAREPVPTFEEVLAEERLAA
jgi:hypothetical protein